MNTNLKRFLGVMATIIPIFSITGYSIGFGKAALLFMGIIVGIIYVLLLAYLLFSD